MPVYPGALRIADHPPSDLIQHIECYRDFTTITEGAGRGHPTEDCTVRRAETLDHANTYSPIGTGDATTTLTIHPKSLLRQSLNPVREDL